NILLNNLIKWDNIYFTKLFNFDKEKDIIFEHEYVFGPLWWRLINFLKIKSFYKNFIIALMITNLCHFSSSIILYELTFTCFKSLNPLQKRVKNLSLISSLFFIISPAGIFLTTTYSESFCSLLSFTSLYLREISLKYNFDKSYEIKKIFPYFLSGTFASIAVLTRSNTLLLGILYLFDLINNFFYYKNLNNARWSLLTGFQVFISFSALNVIPYFQFCPERTLWCANKIPSLLLFAQSNYWNTGFLKYWTLNNIPNFLFCLPTIIVIINSLFYFTYKYPCLIKIKVILIISTIYLFLNLFFWHVQIINRISTFLPISYWYMADLFITENTNKLLSINEKKGKPTINDFNFSKSFIYYSVIWITVQTGLYGMFLPPA
ncbi:hypothetical protein PACTADRAFT_25288, partial [Pachysolen tannophilus NRRL Y-2460]